MTPVPKTLYALNKNTRKIAPADPPSCSQHTRMFNTLSKNMLHLDLQGPHVSARTVWLRQGKEELMLEERRLKCRKWFSELLSVMIPLGTIQNLKIE